MDEDIKQLLNEVIQHVDDKAIETQSSFIEQTNELKQYFDEKTVETRRHFEVLTEHIDGRFDLLAEQIVANTEKLVEHDQRFDKIDQRLEVLEVKMVSVEEDVKFIKTELPQKASKQEFVLLETRVRNFEQKV